MIKVKGKSRVVIENVQPQIDQGLYPAKRTVGERVDVSADIFGDGHDHLRAQVLYRKQDDHHWQHVEMKPGYNDNWWGSFYVPEKTVYVFTVQAWIDHFDTWYDGFKKKAHASVDVHTEIKEGILLLKRLSKEKNERLRPQSLRWKVNIRRQYRMYFQMTLESWYTIFHLSNMKLNMTKYLK